MKKSLLVCLSMLAIAAVVSCTRKQEPPPAKQVRVSATKAFEKYFGPAPTTDKGSCYAFVIYFPSAKDPGKVIPFPFFTFDQESLKKVAVQRLVGGMTDLKGYQGEILQPFPQGVRLLALEEKGGVVTANFSPEMNKLAAGDSSATAAANALSLTLKQFPGVREVRVTVDAKEGSLDPLLARADERSVLPLPPPRLLSVTAMRENGEKEIKEVNAFFDRPVEIKSLRLSDKSGNQFQGDIYQSVFDMAGVMKPKNPELFKAGMPVKVQWNVTDKVGRTSTGDAEVSLEVKEH
ncbi:GerMN domain-containing protein [Geomonas sp. Red32]|uniref:GerMN domain-containing protein n=1 Tax=Geomonas sp. Red32 TaxID=2912856 RepID=UPI00202D0972|nr:GerMN domain-containing protein [Geomonas sp. Red32]MCM0081759.1 GerMN domain-containing protein [Geomonas sp. Red32]